MQTSLSISFWVADETASIFQYNLFLFDADRMSKCLAKEKNQLQFVDSGTNYTNPNYHYLWPGNILLVSVQ